MNRTKKAVIEREIKDLEVKLDVLDSIKGQIIDEIWDAHRDIARLEDELAADRWAGREQQWTNGDK